MFSGKLCSHDGSVEGEVGVVPRSRHSAMLVWKRLRDLKIDACSARRLRNVLIKQLLSTRFDKGRLKGAVSLAAVSSLSSGSSWVTGTRRGDDCFSSRSADVSWFIHFIYSSDRTQKKSKRLKASLQIQPRGHMKSSLICIFIASEQERGLRRHSEGTYYPAFPWNYYSHAFFWQRWNWQGSRSRVREASSLLYLPPVDVTKQTFR